jgi:hypothetical protein
VAAALLALAGGQKLVDPTMTVGALRALRVPASPTVVRMGSAAELALGVVALAVGGRLTWVLVAISYLAFGVFVVAALRADTMIGTCGCFGRDETPPHPLHVGLDLALAAVALACAAVASGSPLDVVVEHPGEGAVLVALAALGVWLLHAAFVDLPRALAAGSTVTR